MPTKDAKDKAPLHSPVVLPPVPDQKEEEHSPVVFGWLAG
jgi:hypothetical protein